MLVPLALALLQPTQGVSPSAANASPVARIVIAPAPLVVAASDSLRLAATAYDSTGKVLDRARLRFYGGASNAGVVDSAGLVLARGTGKITGVVMALVPGRKPFLHRFEVRVVPDTPARIEIGGLPATLVVGQRVRASAEIYTASSDRRTGDVVRWRSSAPEVARVDESGVVTALAPGRTVVTALDEPATAAVAVTVVASTIASVEVVPSVQAVRTGDVVHLVATARDARGRAIAGLVPTWSFGPGNGQLDPDGTFVAYAPGTYVVTASYGSRSADAVITAAPRDVRRAVRVVGRLGRTAFPTSEVWLHPNGKVAYLGTHGGGDRLYVIDVSDPSHPVVRDSLQSNTRLVNDVMTTPDGRYLVFTREGASDRRNGIVIADARDPLHPKVLTEFTEGVTGGVHSAFVYAQPKFGTHVYLTNDATGAIHVLDIGDPAHPREVAQWKTPGSDRSGRYVHDVDVQDGLLYGSWWNDGLVILDVGNGIRGGSPSDPRFVAQYKYDLDALYRDVEAVSGPGFTRGTHTAWRHRDYVFIADEVYRNGTVTGAKDASASRMYGTLQVIDVRDIEHPRAVAWYTPEYGGVHNLWVQGDTLYMGAYDGGFRAFDVSGELRGDLRAQGREIAHLQTADLEGFTKNAAFTWGAVVNPSDGLAYVSDFNNGLWVVRIEPKSTVVP